MDDLIYKMKWIKEKINNAWNWIKRNVKKIVFGTVITAYAAETIITGGAVAITVNDFNGKEIITEYTDSLDGECFEIRAEKATTTGWSEADIYFSIFNGCGDDDNIDLTFEDLSGNLLLELKEIKNVPYEDYYYTFGDEYETWMDGFNATGTTKDRTRHTTTEYKDVWEEVSLANSVKVSGDFKSNKKATYSIKDGETIFFKAKIKMPTEWKVSGKYDIVAQGSKGYGRLDPWFSTDYLYCKPITIESDLVATTTPAFPILATTTDADLKTVGNGGKVEKSAGEDIIFTSGTSCTDGGSLLDYEIEKYVPTTGELIAWIEIDIDSGTDRTFPMYYGNSSASDVSTTTGVWDADSDGSGKPDFRVVTHLAQDPSVDTDGFCGGGTDEVCDSSVDEAHFDSFGSMTSGDLVAAPIGDGIDFDGSNDYLHNAGWAWASAGPVTVSYWSNPFGADEGSLWGVGAVNLQRFQAHAPWSNSILYWDYGDASSGRISSNISAYNGVWANYCLTASGNGGSGMKIMVNGGAVAQDTTTDQPTSISGLSVGRYDLVFEPYDFHHRGIIDEFRIADLIRTDEWCETEYNNQSDMDAFLTFGSEEEPPVPTVSVKKRFLYVE